MLRQYSEHGSEPAFAELVRRRIGLVYSVALRQANGDRHRAEDVTQSVFVDLARKAGMLAGRPVIAGWLYRSARFAAAGLVRSEQRRHARDDSPLQRVAEKRVRDHAPTAIHFRDHQRVVKIRNDAVHVVWREQKQRNARRRCARRHMNGMPARR